MTTQEHESAETERQRAEKRFQDGIEAYNDGKLETAAEAFGDAERRSRVLGAVKQVGDSHTLLNRK
jgi:outer membrane protein assembly factor BamD (BamD/ComL family)